MKKEKPKNIMDNRIITLGRFRTNINSLCHNIREIYHNNYSFIALLFVIIYAVEQGTLLFFSIKLSPTLALGVGLFNLIMLTTIAIERLLLESRNKRISDLNSENLYLNKQYKEKIKLLQDQNKELIDIMAVDNDMLK